MTILSLPGVRMNDMTIDDHNNHIDGCVNYYGPTDNVTFFLP